MIILMVKGPFTPEIYQAWTIAWNIQSTQLQKKGTQPILNFSVRAKVDQIASMNATT